MSDDLVNPKEKARDVANKLARLQSQAYDVPRIIAILETEYKDLFETYVAMFLRGLEKGEKNSRDEIDRLRSAGNHLVDIMTRFLPPSSKDAEAAIESWKLLQPRNRRG